MEPFQIHSKRLAEDPGREAQEPEIVQIPEPGHFDRPVDGNGTGEVFQQGGQTRDDGTRDKEEEGIDPLDAFMAEIHALEKEQQTEKDQQERPVDQQGKYQGQKNIERADSGKPPSAKRHRPERFEAEDYLEDFLESEKGTNSGEQKILESKGTSFVRPEKSEEILEFLGNSDSDEEVYRAAELALASQQAGKNPRPVNDLILPEIDHSMMAYESFRKDFYVPCSELASLSQQEVFARRRALSIKASGLGSIPAPVQTFEQCNLGKPLLAALRKANYKTPTPIQSQAIPVALSGRNIIGMAPTGSGKSVAFLLPMIVHVMDQRELSEGEGPIALVIAPTRELAEQIHREARKFGRPYNLAICAAFGGLQRHAQIKELQAGSEIAICTPGRWIDLLKAKGGTNCQRITYLVLDEADRMFDMGFGNQVRAILGQIRPDCQTLLFSATMPGRIQKLVAEFLPDPVRISIGTVGAANIDVKQEVHVLKDEDSKFQWVLERISAFVDEGDVLVFVSRRDKAESIARNISNLGIARISALHGDMDQASRSKVVEDLKAGNLHVIVATDVAARGLDIKSVKTVINFDPAKDSDTLVHRVGRCGRAGDKEGTAHSLLLPTDIKAAVDVARCLSASGNEVPPEVMKMAEQNPKWKRQRYKGIGINNNIPSFALQSEKGPDPWHSGRQEALGQHFRSSFVSAGVRQDSKSIKAEIILPKSSTVKVESNSSIRKCEKEMLPPQQIPAPPIPVAEQPMYLNSRQEDRQAEEVAKAVAKAREIAARLMAQKNQNPGS